MIAIADDRKTQSRPCREILPDLLLAVLTCLLLWLFLSLFPFFPLFSEATVSLLLCWTCLSGWSVTKNVALTNHKTNGGIRQVRSWPWPHLSAFFPFISIYLCENSSSVAIVSLIGISLPLFPPSGFGCFLDCNYLAVIIKPTIYYLLANKRFLPGLSFSSGPVLSERKLVPHYSPHLAEVC